MNDWIGVGFMHGLYPPEVDGEPLIVNETAFWWEDESETLPGDPVFEKRVADSRRILDKMISFFKWHKVHSLNLLTMSDFFMAKPCSDNTYNEIVTDGIYERMMDDFDFLTVLGRSKKAQEEFEPYWKTVD
jgi:hypothetical protein